MGQWGRWISRIAIAIAAIAALLALPVALPKLLTEMEIEQVIPSPPPGMIVVIAIEAAPLILVAIWWLWWRLPQRQVAGLSMKIRDAKSRADVEDNFRKTIGQALGGMAVLIGAVVAYLEFTQQQRAAHDLLISNQVAKGFEQLASDKVALRLSGIYALEGVMNTATDYHEPVLEALCAFVRDSTIGMIVGEHPAIDIQAALTVIARRAGGPGRVELAGANISGAVLRNADLRGAILSGANLSNAYLINTNLNGASLRDAHLDGAFLIRVSLEYAVLEGTDLRGASLLAGVNLRSAFISDSQLDRACSDDKVPVRRKFLELKRCPSGIP